MFDHLQLQKIWSQAHQRKSDLEQPEASVVSFAEFGQQYNPSGSFVLDAGCDRGRNASYLAQQEYTVFGCDLSPVAIAKAREKIQQLHTKPYFLVADLTRLPFSEMQFDMVICVHVLPYHFKADIVQCIHAIQRVLRSNGWLCLDFLACDDAEYGCGPELEPHTFLDPDGVPIHFCSEQAVRDMLKGFTIKRLTRLAQGPQSRKRISWEVWATKN